jgi:hypothetical protein
VRLSESSLPLTSALRLFSLLCMLRRYANLYVTGYDSLKSICGILRQESEGPSLSVQHHDTLCDALGFVAQDCRATGMSASEHLARETIQMIQPGSSNDTVITRIYSVLSLIRKELEEKQFLYIPTELVAYYERDDLFGQLVSKKIPKAKENIREAGTCLALERPTACVAHLMHAVAAGMELVAKNLSVKYSQPIEILDWQNIIQPIQAKIKEWQQKHPKSQRKYDALEQYSKIATQFDYFKHAWRNKVSHVATLYDIHQAKSVMSRTETLLQEIAESKSYKP